MLRIRTLDKVQIHIPLKNKDHFGVVESALYDTAALHQRKVIFKSNQYQIGKYLCINVDGVDLEIGSYFKYGHRWLMYRFKGVVDCAAMDGATICFGPYSFLGALQAGRVKALELALDIAGLRSADYMVHLRGAKKSHVCTNAEGTGSTHYVGSRSSPRQFVLYDKAQERRDKKLPCAFKDLLRFELRIRDQPTTLTHVIAELVDNDPFQQLRVIDRKAALAYPKGGPQWGLFLSACSDYGVARALQLFGQHKKTYLKIFDELSLERMCPRIADFVPSLEALFPSKLLWDVVHQSLDGAKPTSHTASGQCS